MKLNHTIQISVWSKDDKPRQGDHCGHSHSVVPEDISAEGLQALLAKMMKEADASFIRGLKYHPVRGGRSPWAVLRSGDRGPHSRGRW